MGSVANFRNQLNILTKLMHTKIRMTFSILKKPVNLKNLEDSSDTSLMAGETL